MRRQDSQRQLSRRGISMVFVYLFLILIAIFSGFIVRFMAGALIRQHIEQTLGLRLLLHSVGLAYNSMYSLPSGQTRFSTTYPSRCSLKCVDCNASIIWNPLPTWNVSCDCSNGINECTNPQEVANGKKCKTLLNYPPDTKKLVCDDYIIDSIKPVILFKGSTPTSMAIMTNLYIYPVSNLFWQFNDFLSKYIGNNIINNVPFFDRQITIFSEMPLNLNDYTSIRALFKNNQFINFGEKTFTIYRNSYDNYDSLVNNNINPQGLQGLVNVVYLFNKSNEQYKNYNFILQPSQKLNSTKSNVCEYEDYFIDSLNISPHKKWDKVACFNFSSFGDYDISLCDGECMGSTNINLNKLTFADIFTGSPNYDNLQNDIILSNFKIHYFMTDVYITHSDIHKQNLGYNCSLMGNFDYCVYKDANGDYVGLGRCGESGNNIPVLFKSIFPSGINFVTNINGLTPSNNCIFDDVNYQNDKCNVKIYQCGRVLFYDGDTRLASMPKFYSKGSSTLCNYCTYTKGNYKEILTGKCEAREGYETLEGEGDCHNYSAKSSDNVVWDLSKDCLLTSRCNEKGIEIIISDNPNSDIIKCEKTNGFINDICKLFDRILIRRFSGCTSKGNYFYSYKDFTKSIDIKDFPITTLLGSLLTSNLKEMTYDINIIKPLNESYVDACKNNDLTIKLESTKRLNIHSKKVTDNGGGVNDKVFTLNLQKEDNKIKVRISE